MDLTMNQPINPWAFGAQSDPFQGAQQLQQQDPQTTPAKLAPYPSLMDLYGQTKQAPMSQGAASPQMPGGMSSPAGISPQSFNPWSTASGGL
jgi:hypothetical protein